MFALTPRLTLRPAWPEDAPALASAIAHRAVVEKLSRVPWPYREADADEFIARARRQDEPLFLITSRGGAPPRLLGGIGLHADHCGPELGYWLTPDAWGRGFATEAGRAVIDIARHALGLKRLRSNWHAGNPASGRVLEKLGFARTGETLRLPSRALGREVEAVAMTMELGAPGAPLAIAA